MKTLIEREPLLAALKKSGLRDKADIQELVYSAPVVKFPQLECEGNRGAGMSQPSPR